jgi:hypothetical protein
MKGNQNLTISKSGFSRHICFAVVNQLIGFTELRRVLMGMPSGAGSFSAICVVPGNRKLGYCREKETMEQS